MLDSAQLCQKGSKIFKTALNCLKSAREVFEKCSSVLKNAQEVLESALERSILFYGG